MIKVIDIASKQRTPVPEGHLRTALDPSADGTRVHVAIVEVEAGGTHRLPPSDRTQVVYILDGRDARITHTRAGAATEHVAQRRSGVYLEP